MIFTLPFMVLSVIFKLIFDYFYLTFNILRWDPIVEKTNYFALKLGEEENILSDKNNLNSEDINKFSKFFVILSVVIPLTILVIIFYVILYILIIKFFLKNFFLALITFFKDLALFTIHFGDL
jgi:hypothetical protein